MSIEFIDNTDEKINALNEAVKSAMEEIGSTVTNDIKANSPVDTGRLQASYTYVPEGMKVTIGSPVDYSIYVEFKSPGNGGRPHFRNTFESDISKIQQILQSKLSEI